MDKLELLKTRRAEVLAEGKEIRAKISEFIDSDSFVEFDSYSFSANDFYEGNVGGEGVVTGVATINDIAVYIVAQNFAKMSGGITNANCQKIVKCQQKALNANAPVIYLLNTQGVCVGEGVNVLEGMANVIAYSHELKNCVPQFAVTLGDVYGTMALLVANCDYNFMLKNSCVAYASPLVIGAGSNKNVGKEVVGGIESGKYNGLTTFTSENLSGVRDTIAKILDTLPAFNGEVQTMDDFNRATPSLNEKVCPNCLVKAVFDQDYFIEMGKDFAPEVTTGIGRVGGMSVGAVIFGGEDKGVELTKENIFKIKEFLYYCDANELPVITFVNTLGIKADLQTANSTVIKDVANLSYAINELSTARLNVIYGKAVGLGYTLFASKSLGASCYTYAFANAKVSLFDTDKGAMIELAGVTEGNKEKAEERYADQNQDPFNAARNGYIDDIIEPQFVRAYLINALQILV